MSTQNGTGRVYPEGTWSAIKDGKRFVLTHTDMDAIRDRLLAGEHHDVIGEGFGRSKGWGYQLGVVLGLVWDRRTRRWVEAGHLSQPVRSAPMPMLAGSAKEQNWVERITELTEALEMLDAKLTERDADIARWEKRAGDQNHDYQQLSAEYETLKADNERMARHIEDLELQLRALTTDGEEEAAIEDAYDRAGTLLGRIKTAWGL